MAHHVQLLVNDDDPGLLRLPGIMEFDFLSLESDGTGVFGIDSGEHFHQGGLAGAVFTHEGMDFPATDFKIDMIQGVNAGEVFVDPFHCQDHFSHEASSFGDDHQAANI